MDLQIEDILKIDIVLVGVQLLSGPADKAIFDEAVGAEVTEAITEGIAVSVGPSGISPITPPPPQPRLLTLQKERITLDLAPGRSSISKEYPEEGAIGRLAEVADLAITGSNDPNQELRAFGFNLEAVCELPSDKMAYQFLASNIYASNIAHNSEFALTDGSPRMSFQRGNDHWNVVIEPRFRNADGSKIFMSLNLHKDSSAMPPGEEIYDSLRTLWDHAYTFVDIFGGRM